MKHELQIHTEAVYAQTLHFYEVCSHIIALFSPVWPQTSDKRLSLLSYKLPFNFLKNTFKYSKSHSHEGLQRDKASKKSFISSLKNIWDSF